MSYKKYWNSTNEKSYEPFPEWDVGFNELLGHCFNPERDKHWYLIAYHNLSIYHIKLKQKTTVKIHLLKGIMETLINCMVNKKNNSLMYKDNDFNRIKSQLTLGSEFQKESRLDNDKILHMKVILNDMNVLLNNKEDNSHKYERNYTNNTEDSHKYERNYNGGNTNNTEDSEILSHCEEIIKSQQWYKDGWNLIVRFYKKIQNNLLPKKTAYAAIGTLLNCLINNTNTDPVFNKSNLFFITNKIEDKNSSFYTRSKLDIKYTELNYVYKDWYFAYGIKGDPSGICKPRDNNYNHNHQHNHEYNHRSGAHPPPPRSEHHYNFRSGAYPPPPPQGGHQYNYWSGAHPPPPQGRHQYNYWNGAHPPPPPQGGHQYNYWSGAPPPPPRGSAGESGHGYNHRYNRGSDKHSHYKGLVHSRCDTANRDHKWYKDAFDLIIQVKNFAQDTRSKDDYGIVGLLLNCIVNNKNTIIDRETNGSEWRKIGLIFHPDRITKDQAKDFMKKTGYTEEQMLMLSQIQSQL